MPQCKVGADPINEVVFKCPFDELVKEVRGDQLIDIRAREVDCEWLGSGERRDTIGSPTIPSHPI